MRKESIDNEVARLVGGILKNLCDRVREMERQLQGLGSQLNAQAREIQRLEEDHVAALGQLQGWLDQNYPPEG